MEKIPHAGSNHTHQLSIILVVGAALRLLLLALPHFQDLWQRVELCNRSLCLPYVREVAFRMRHGLKPYEFGVLLPNPILTLLVSWLDEWHLGRLALVALDITVALLIHSLGKKILAQTTATATTTTTITKTITTRTTVSPSLINIAVAAYLFNPYNLLSTAALSLAPLIQALLLGGINVAIDKKPWQSAILMSSLLMLNPYGIGIMGPILTFLHGPGHRLQFLLAWIISLTSLLGISWYQSEATLRFFHSTFGSILSLASLRPNIGLYWYLSTEMFDFFRPFFTFFIQIHAFFYGIPVYIRFRRDPFFMTWLIIAIQALLHPYPTVSDTALYLSLLPLFPDLWSKSGILEWLLIAIAFVSVQAPVTWYFWVFQGSGNANFYYAITLIYNIAQVLIILDMVRIHVTNDVLNRNPTLTKDDLYQK